MKRTIASLAALLLLAACGSNGSQFTITVNLGDSYENAHVVLLDEVTGQPLDSAEVRNAQVVFTGKVSTPFVGQVVVNGDQAHNILFVEPGQIYLDPVLDSLSGTPLNDAYASLLHTPEIQEAYYAFLYQYVCFMTGDAELQTCLLPVLDSLYTEWEFLRQVSYRALFTDHPDDLLGAYALAQMSTYFLTAAELEQALEGASDLVRNYAPIQARLEQLHTIDRTAVGTHYLDFPGTAYPSGEATTLGSMIEGKLALVDVWASWCGPCREEIKEHLIRIHNEYGPKGLYVLGVDVSDKAENHAQAVKELGITYDQLVDSEGLCCDLYGIQAIPHILLIAPDGTILARDLQGNEIEAAVQAALE